MDVTLKNNTDQSLSVYYYVGSVEKIADVPAGGSLQLSSITALSPSSERLLKSKYLTVVYTPEAVASAPSPAHISGMAWANRWNQNVSYVAGYVTAYSGSVWLANKNSRNSEPSTSNSDWELIGVQAINALLGVEIEDIGTGSVIYKNDEGGWSFGPLSDSMISGLLSISKIDGLESALGDKLSKTGGGTITGEVLYTGEATAGDSLVNKSYVDTKLPLTGGTLGGTVSYEASIPVTGTYQLAHKYYVDSVNSGRLPLTGGILTGFLVLHSNPVSANHAANKAYTDTKLALTGGTLTSFLTLHDAPSLPLHAASKAYVDAQALAGGVLTGKIQLPTSIPINNALDLTSKAYVDAQALAGGVLTGKIQLPTSIQVIDNSDLTNKLYVDSAMLGNLSKSGGTMTGLIYYNLPREGVSADPDTDIFECIGHGFKSGRRVKTVFSSGFEGLESGSEYYVVDVDDVDQFKLAVTFGNSTVGAAGATLLTTGSTESLEVGQEIGGTGFQTGSTITSIDSPTTFTISHTLLLSQPRPIDITSSGVGAVVSPTTQEPEDQIPTKGYIDDTFGVSGSTLPLAGGTMLGAIRGNHGLLQIDGSTAMLGSIILANLSDVSMDGDEERVWTILAFAYHSPTESKVYLDDITGWASHHEIGISGTVLYDGDYDVEEVDQENGYLVIQREFDGTVSGTAKQYAGGLYFSTTNNGVSHKRRKFLSRGAVTTQGGDYDVLPSDGVVLSSATSVAMINLGDPESAPGQVVIKKLGNSDGSLVIVKSNDDGDSNLVLDTKNDAVIVEPIKDENGNFQWTPVARIRNGENVSRVLFRGSMLRYPGSIDIDISNQFSLEKTTKVTSVASITIAAVACLELTVEDASDFGTANVITIEGSISGYNGSYSESNVINVDTDSNKIILTNINSVTIVNEGNFFIVADVYQSMKSVLALSSSPVINDVKQSYLSSRIAGFASAGNIYSEPSSSSEESPQYTDVILGNNVSIESIENIPAIIDGIATTGAFSPYSLTRPGHGLVNGDQVVFSLDGASSSSSSEAEQFTGLVDGETYYVINVVDELDDDFDLSQTEGGAAVAVTGVGVNGTLTKSGSSGILKVFLNRDEFNGAFVSGEIVAGSRININWASVGGSAYDGSYLVDDADIGDDETLPSVTIRGQYLGVLTSEYPKMAEAVNVSNWIPGFHLVQIINYPDYYSGLYDLIAVDPVYGKLTIKKAFVAPSEPSSTPGIDIVSRSTHAIYPHPSVFGKVVSGEGGDLVSVRTDGDGDLTIRLRNPITDVEEVFPTDVAGIANEISGTYLHAISGGIYDLVGEVSANVINAQVYSATILSGGGVADGDGNIAFEMQNVIGFREGDTVRISDEVVDRIVVSLADNLITVDGGSYTITGTPSLVNNKVITLVLDDMSSGAFDVGDPVLIRDVTSLGSDLIKTTIDGVASLIRSPYTAPRVVIRGFNKEVDDPDGEPLTAQTMVVDDTLIFDVLHPFTTGQKIRVSFATSIYTGFSATDDVYAIRVGVSSIKIATSQFNAFDGRAINLTGSAQGTVTPLVSVSTPFDPDGVVSGTIEVPKVLGMYSIRPWTWMSWRGAATLNSGAIEEWEDYSGNLRNFIQATSANRPLYVTSGFNNITAIRYADFTSNDKTLSHALSFSKPQGVTIMFVSKMTSDGFIFKSGSTISLERVTDGGDGFYTLLGSSGSEISGGKSGAAAGVYTIVLNGENSRFRKFTSFAAAPQEVFGTILGDLETNIAIGSSSGGFNGSLATFMVFSSALNEDQISFLERSLAYEHGITILSNNAYLNSLSFSNGVVFTPTFNGYVFTGYAVSVVNATSTTTVTAVTVQANATMRLRVNGGSWSTLTSGIASGSIALAAGDNTIDVEVTAQDDTTDETYSVVVTRRAAPSVSSPTVGSIDDVTAILGGTVTANNGSAITSRGIVYAETALNPTPIIDGNDVTRANVSGAVGTFTKLITGLTADTDYSYRAYATNAEGISYTTVDTFSTIGPPVVTSPTVTSIASDGATLGGDVSSDGGDTIVERGIVYAVTGDNADPEIGESGVTKREVSGTTGVFTEAIIGLTADTGYSYKAYATNSQGTTYTTVDTFTTLV